MVSPTAVVFGIITVPVKHCQSSCWAPSAGARGWWCCWSRRAAEPGCLPGSRPGPSLSAWPWPEGTWEYWLRPTPVKDIYTNMASHHRSLRNTWNSYELIHFKRKLDDHYCRKFCWKVYPEQSSKESRGVYRQMSFKHCKIVGVDKTDVKQWEIQLIRLKRKQAPSPRDNTLHARP